MTKIKKIVFCICLLIALICITNISNAITMGTIYVIANKEIIEVGEEIEIIINLKDIKTAAFTSYLNFDNTKLEYISGPENSNVIKNSVIHVWYDGTGGANAKNGELAKFKFKALQNGAATFSVNGEFYSDQGQQIDMNFRSFQIQIGKEETLLQKQAKEELGTDNTANNSKLKALRLDIEGIVPTFASDIYQYYLTTLQDISSVEVLATSENPNATIEITGNNNLKQGLNDIIIKVISEDKTKESVYKITITKTTDLEAANTNLETLAIEDVLLNPPFYTNITNYNIEVSNKVTSLNILAIPENEQGTTQIIGNENLKEGNNQIKIVVTAPNGYTKREYIITVYKRNSEEEQKYQEQQKSKLDSLEEAYKIENNKELNSENNISEEEISSKNIIIYIIIGIIIAFVIILGISYRIIKKYKNIEK